MSDEMLVRHCAPTLAGMNTGNMFTCNFENPEDMRRTLSRYNKRLSRKGLRVIPLRFKDGRALIYVYRPAKLRTDLTHSTAERLLREYGYGKCSSERCIRHLVGRLKDDAEFPHEIGLFIGYPPEDVEGFIEKGGEGCSLVGSWKVYGDEDSARRTFARYKKCTAVYGAKLASGTSVERLTVAV